jgi:hypothetical protein
MIVLRNKYFSEDDNLSAEAPKEKKKHYKRNNTIGYGVAGLGLGYTTGALYAAQSKTGKKILGLRKRLLVPSTKPGYFVSTDEGRWKRLGEMFNKRRNKSTAIGTAIGTAALGTLGYLRGRYKANKREDRRTAVLNRMQ